MKLLLGLCLLCPSLCVSWPGFTAFSKGGRGQGFRDFGWGRKEVCKTEDVTIPQMVCRLEWEEECSTSNKKIGEKVIYQKKCEDREVKVCKWVQFFHPQYPSLGISGGAGKEYEDCEKVTKEFCKDVPEEEDVMADVETCVNTPKQVCKEGMIRTWRETCDRIKSGSTQSENSETESIMPRKPKSDDPPTDKTDDSNTQEADDSVIDDTVDLTPVEGVDNADEVVNSTSETIDPTQEEGVNATTINPK